MRLYGKEKISVRNCGLFLHQSFIAFGASPDGIVQKNTNTYLIEIKCSFKWRNSTILEACKSPDFYCYLDSNNKIQLILHPNSGSNVCMSVQGVSSCFVYIARPDCYLNPI